MSRPSRPREWGDLPSAIGGARAGRLRAVGLWRLRRLWSNLIRVATLALKRVVDILGALLLLTLLAPLFAGIALLIKLEDPGPVLFWQDRVGQWGVLFRFPKFRSMVVDAEARKAALLAENDHGSSVTFKMKRDPRVTRVGAILRRGSLDELPQLWSVLRGEMSLVGPRPPVPSEVELYSPADRRRLDVRPGLTCLWQVSGRGEIPFPEQVELDSEYIESRGFWTDVVLLLRTIPAVVLGRGAY